MAFGPESTCGRAPCRRAKPSRGHRRQARNPDFGPSELATPCRREFGMLLARGCVGGFKHEDATTPRAVARGGVSLRLGVRRLVRCGSGAGVGSTVRPVADHLPGLPGG